MTISTLCRGVTSIIIIIIIIIIISELNVEDCATNTQVCNRNAVCKTMEESSICICNPGYAGNGKICTGNHYKLTYILLCV